MQEHHSILFRPINALLIRLLGEPPVDRMSPGVAHFFFPDGKEAWIPDTAIMALLLTLVIFILFRMAAGRYDARPPFEDAELSRDDRLLPARPLRRGDRAWRKGLRQCPSR